MFFLTYVKKTRNDFECKPQFIIQMQWNFQQIFPFHFYFIRIEPPIFLLTKRQQIKGLNMQNSSIPSQKYTITKANKRSLSNNLYISKLRNYGDFSKHSGFPSNSHNFSVTLQRLIINKIGMDFKYDVIVIGAGHAGCEAAAAAANLGSKTCLITMDMNKIGQMSCNPAVGGIAKGQIVREIDALGGQMGLVTDETAIQFRILNRSKGPAMWSLRAQCDRAKFIWSWRERLENTPNLHIWQDTVCELLVENGEVTGLVTAWGVTFKAKCIVLTAGTFLNGLMHVGRHKLPGGRMAEPASYHLTESIARHGITYGRMKTGTPVRIDARSVHFDQMETQDGECDFHKFSFMNTSTRHLKQLQCWTCYTNEEVHQILREGLPDSPLLQRTDSKYRSALLPEHRN